MTLRACILTLLGALQAFANGFGFLREKDFIFPDELADAYSNRAFNPTGRDRVELLSSDARFTLASFFKNPAESGRSIGFQDYYSDFNLILSTQQFAHKFSFSFVATNHDFVTVLTNASDTLPINIRKSNYHMDLGYFLFANHGPITYRFHGSWGLVTPDLGEYNSVIQHGFAVGSDLYNRYFFFADLSSGYYMPGSFKLSQGINSFVKPSLHSRFYLFRDNDNFNLTLLWMFPFDVQNQKFEKVSFTQPENTQQFFEWLAGYEFNLPNYGNSLTLFFGSLMGTGNEIPRNKVEGKRLDNPWIMGAEMNLRFFGKLL